MSEGNWWPNWYVTRLHWVPDDIPEEAWSVNVLCDRTNAASPKSPARSGEWQQRRIRAGVPKCKHCLRKLGVAA